MLLADCVTDAEILLLLDEQGIGMSVFRGTGRQMIGAVIVFVSFYIIALVTGVPLMFATHLEVAGIVILLITLNRMLLLTLIHVFVTTVFAIRR